MQMFGCKCDNCGIQWKDDDRIAYTDAISMQQVVENDSEWQTDNSGKKIKHYCPKCFGGFDDNDKLIISEVKEHD